MRVFVTGAGRALIPQAPANAVTLAGSVVRR
jgi:hypothetical protein